jgi:hypothetical protein
VTNVSIDLATAPRDSDPVPLLFWVPADKVLATQAQVAELLRAQSGGIGDGGAYKPPFSNTHGPRDAWQLPPWEGNEQDAATWILRVVTDNQRRVLAHLISAGQSGVWTAELRHTAGYEPGSSMSGVFKAIGGRFRSVGLRPLWNGGPKDSEKGQKLHVGDENVKRLFANLIMNCYADLAAEFRIALAHPD